MQALILAFTIIYCIGIFFSIALANIGHLGLIGLLLLQFYLDKNFQKKFFDFHTTHKLWIPIVYIVLVAFIFSFRGNISNGLTIFCKYVRILSLLILIPTFIGNSRLQKIFAYSFFISGACYTLFKYLGHNSSPNIIHTSIYIACASLYFIIKTLVIFPKKQWFLYSCGAFLFLFSLFCVNIEKTGVAATVAATVAAKKSLSIFLRLSGVLLIFSCVIFLSNRQNTVLWKRFLALKDSSYSQRALMLKQAKEIIKEHPEGVSTGNYPKALAEHDFSHLDATGNKINPHAHPHNEWVMFLVLWGVFGLVGLVGVFGYIIHYFLKRIQWNNFMCENNFHVGFALAVVVIYLVSGCCEAVFFMTLPQSAFCFWMALCFAGEYEQQHKKPTPGY